MDSIHGNQPGRALGAAHGELPADVVHDAGIDEARLDIVRVTWWMGKETSPSAGANEPLSFWMRQVVEWQVFLAQLRGEEASLPMSSTGWYYTKWVQ